MFMIRAIVRPEKYEEVMAALLDADIPGVTRLSIQGRGRQRGLKVGGTHYDELPKEMLLVVVTAAEKDYALNAILRAARTGEKGVFGDGKIFVSAVEEVHTVSSGKREWPQE